MFTRKNKQLIALIAITITTLFILYPSRYSDDLPEKKGIIFIPGFLGSEIHSTKELSSNDYLTKLTNEDFETINYPENYRFWPPASVTGDYAGIADLVNKKRIQTDTSMLLCDFNGVPLVPTIATDLDDTDNLYGAINYYGPLMNNLKTTFINEYNGENNIHYFNYDWRLSTKDAAKKLETFINDNNYTEITLIGYSMGGLIASIYIADNIENAKKVKKLITIGTPYLGTPKAIHALATGKALGFYENIVMANPLKELFSNFISSYELLPSEKYFSLNNTSYIRTYKENPNWFKNNNTAIEITNFLDSSNIINSIWGANRPFMKNAENIHDKLFLPDGKHITSTVDSYYIIGHGIETMEKVEIQYDTDGKYTSVTDVNSSLLGDGSVPIISANIGQTTPKEKTFYINEDHNNLIKNQEVIELIDNIIKNNPNTNESIAHSDNITVGQFFIKKSPINYFLSFISGK